MDKVSLALLILILAHWQANSMESPLSLANKTLKRAERLTLALKVLNYGMCGFIGWQLKSLMPQNNVVANKTEEVKITAYEEGKKEGFLQGKCNKKRILWNYWARTEYGNHYGFSSNESKKWQYIREKAGQEYFDCRKKHEHLAKELASKI